MRLILFSFFCFWFFASCQKEASFETNGPAPSATAAFTFAEAPGTCTAATVAGLYSPSTALTDANTVTITINVTRTGSYSVTTNKVNGYSFSATGSFASTGVQTITLKASGTPVAAGTDGFTPISNGVNGCTFSITVGASTPAVYTMAGAPSACSNAVVNGTYELNKPLVAANTVTVQVNVTNTGTYTLSTNTVAGMTFSKSGSFTSTGIQNVVLNGTGTPNSVGDKVITPQVGSSSCTFTVKVVGPAVYTLVGAPGACTNATVNGTYTATTPLTNSNTISIQVNVTVLGAFNITTNTVGGMTFSKTGVFTTLGVQSVILNGSGTPVTSGVNNLAITNNGCSFSVTVAPAPAVTGVYQCKINGVLTTFTDRAHAETLDNFFNPPVPRLFLDGYTDPPNGDEIPRLQIFIDKNNQTAITTGTYNVDGFTAANGYRIEIDYHKVNADLSVTIWNTSSSIFSANPPFTIVVTSVTANRVKGTFSGKLTNLLQGSTTTIDITEGVFDLPIVN